MVTSTTKPNFTESVQASKSQLRSEEGRKELAVRWNDAVEKQCKNNPATFWHFNAFVQLAGQPRVEEETAKDSGEPSVAKVSVGKPPAC